MSSESLTQRLSRARARCRRAVLARRRWLAALLAGVAALAALRAVAAPPPPTVVVPVAAHDLSGGTRLEPDDLVEVRFAAGTEPTGLVPDAAGRVLASSVARGEPITTVRLVGPELAEPGEVAVPVRLPDAGMAGLLEVGDRVDLVATDAQSGAARRVAVGVPVLALPGPEESGVASAGAAGPLGGRLVVVGVAEPLVETLSAAGVRDFLTFAWTG